ncbi:uncharacterized protein LOC135195691 isoform X2 [Macrobrachium nipponense]|uniref:uncharacterized protein LOC135195691 isoform X2 n=1 Tax=Macrobrachium nipponense TaxID=159736 RepID=UPI0030C814FC
MWHLAALLLVSALASASPQLPYLPPPPDSCRTVTSLVYDTRIQTSYVVQTDFNVNTQYVTTTVVRQQVVPTTIFSTRVETRPQIVFSTVQQTTIQYIDRVETRTVPSPPIQETRYVTSTRVIPQISYVTQTQIETQVVPVEVTSTQIQTINQPVTNYQTEYRQETRLITIPGPDVVMTRVRTVVQTSVIRSVQPDRTQYITSTQVQQQLQTRIVTGPNIILTSTVQRQQVVPYTTVNTRYENDFVTREQIVTRTNVQTQTIVQTQFVPEEVVRTQVIPTVIYTTIYETRVQPFTQVQTVFRTQYITPPPLVQTREETRTSLVQIPGPDRVVTSQVVQTQQQQQVIYQTTDRVQQITVTQTVTGTCSASGYNYNAPSNQLNIGK